MCNSQCACIAVLAFTLLMPGIANGGACSQELGEMYPIGGQFKFSCNKAPATGRIPCHDYHMVIVETGERVPAERLKLHGNKLTLTERHAAQQRLTYRCMCNSRALSETCIRVDSAPPKVPRHDFNCVTHNLEYMVCRFPHSRRNVPTDYTLTYSSHEAVQFESPRLPCAVQSEFVSCNISRTAYVPTNEHFTVHLKIVNPFGAVKQSFKINNFESVQPARKHLQDNLMDKSMENVIP